MWIYQGENVKNIEDLPEGAIGFVYLIVNHDNNRAYIGKKNLYSERKVNFGKKEIAQLTNKRLKKYKYITKESDWLTYNGSCKDLLEDIANGANIGKIILDVAFSKMQLTYLETKYLFNHDVLESDKFYNENILSKFFKGNIK